MKIGKAIKILRLANEIALGDLARSADVSPGFLSLVESGMKEPSLTTVRRLADGLDIPYEVLLAVSQPKESSMSSSDPIVGELIKSLKTVERAESQLQSKLSRRKDN